MNPQYKCQRQNCIINKYYETCPLLDTHVCRIDISKLEKELNLKLEETKWQKQE